ncbi:MAG: hypothetical protein DRP78_06220 [Candidatus Omnitrophota bacterium]|nr:MAG: hypothetical protein DRP78_06220 [Candidatus Omnitrophota bacterium]
MVEVMLPDLGEDVMEASVSFWYKELGDKVNAGMDLVEVSTDKAAFNVPAPCDGTILEIFVLEGEKVVSGAVLATIREE